MSWFLEYCRTAEQSDQLARKTDDLDPPNDHLTLLLSGLVGEAGSVLVELKKRTREGRAYPSDSGTRLTEELGDVLWYFVRTVQVLAPSLVKILDEKQDSPALPVVSGEMRSAILLSGAASSLLKSKRSAIDDVQVLVFALWDALKATATAAKLKMPDIAENNKRKRQSVWPVERIYAPFFDEGFREEERLPRSMEVEFRELSTSSGKSTVILRCNGLNIGDRLTDNIRSADHYRFHDVFHFAYVAHLGWSPVLRAVLKCKRKSDSSIDENEDGARAGIIEEAVSAMVFNRAKEIGFFQEIDHVDYGLLKTIAGLVKGFEVERVPLWQWDEAIRGGYHVFRQMREHGGGRLRLDAEAHKLHYSRS